MHGYTYTHAANTEGSALSVQSHSILSAQNNHTVNMIILLLEINNYYWQLLYYIN